MSASDDSTPSPGVPMTGGSLDTTITEGIIPLAGSRDATTPTILSIVGGALLPMFDTAEASQILKPLCTEFSDSVKDYQWEDRATVIRGGLKAWRAAFPRARVARVSERVDLEDGDLAHLVGVKEVYMEGCTRVTDAGFAHLKGVRVLDASRCSESLSDAALAHLSGTIRALNLSLDINGNMDARLGITDEGLAHLKGIQDLNLFCRLNLTAAGFAHLAGIHTLNMEGCWQEELGDEAFAHLKGIHTLLMGGCSQPTITPLAFSYLKGIQEVNFDYCDNIRDAHLSHLKGVKKVSMVGCSGITDMGIIHLAPSIKVLHMESCDQPTITTKALEHLSGITELFMTKCSPALIQAALAKSLPVRVVVPNRFGVMNSSVF